MIKSDNISPDSEKFISFLLKISEFFLTIADISRSTRVDIAYFLFLIYMVSYKDLTRWIKFSIRIILAYYWFGNNSFIFIILLLGAFYLFCKFFWHFFIWYEVMTIFGIIFSYFIIKTYFILFRVTSFWLILFSHHD